MKDQDDGNVSAGLGSMLEQERLKGSMLLVKHAVLKELVCD